VADLKSDLAFYKCLYHDLTKMSSIMLSIFNKKERVISDKIFFFLSLPLGKKIAFLKYYI